MGKRQHHHCLRAQEVASKHQRQCVVIEALEDMETIPLGAAAQWALVSQVTGNTLLWDAGSSGSSSGVLPPA